MRIELLTHEALHPVSTHNDNPHVCYEPATSVTDAINTRRSLRAFLSKPVPQQTLQHMLEIAARAPSGTNIQPWKTYVVTGATRDKLCKAVCEAFDDPQIKGASQVDYYPQQWFEPFLGRRRQVGWALYGLLGIEKGERAKTHAQHRRNYQFFDAPVGLIFTIHKDLATGSWLDYGLFMQNLMLLAREHGLHTCPQAAWADYHTTIRQVISLSDDEVVVSGMALGYADPAAIENTLVTERVDSSENVYFMD
ncbi:MAG: nitroreductase [Granulosicoccus sp.]